jgi:hypothetical protein
LADVNLLRSVLFHRPLTIRHLAHPSRTSIPSSRSPSIAHPSSHPIWPSSTISIRHANRPTKLSTHNYPCAPCVAAAAATAALYSILLLLCFACVQYLLCLHTFCLRTALTCVLRHFGTPTHHQPCANQTLNPPVHLINTDSNTRAQRNNIFHRPLGIFHQSSPCQNSTDPLPTWSWPCPLLSCPVPGLLLVLP